MAMTPAQARALAKPIADIYAQLTDDLMTSIAAQLGKGIEVSGTAKWQLNKLAQLGELNARNVRLIAKRTKRCPQLHYLAVISAAGQALDETDKLYQLALAAAELGKPVDFPASDAMMSALQLYQDQAKDLYNLVNTTMAYKARDAYTGIVNTVADVADRDAYTQIIGQSTASVITGIQPRQAALRQCLTEFAAKGMPGFVDKAGREWAPESYINMCIRTTVNQVANDAQFARMDDYGSDLVEVSSHIGARPRCEPFQGRIFSRSGKSGFTEDLNGNKIPFYPWSSTSYGEPGGLLGINCGHQVYPFIPRLSRQTYEPYDKSDNAAAYKDSQKQRALERKVRESKRTCAMLDAAGDTEGFEKAATRLKQREARLKEFAQDTGRTVKSDRVQVPDFGRSEAGKARTAAQRAAAKKTGTISVNNTMRWPDAARRRLRQDESIIAQRKSETAILYDKDGKTILTKRGGELSVSFSRRETDLMPGGVLTHNHPYSTTFSWADISMLQRGGLAEIRATGKDGTFVLRHPEKWPDEIDGRIKIKAAYEEIEAQVEPLVAKRLDSGEIDVVQYNQIYQMHLLDVFASRYGLDYGFEVR